MSLETINKLYLELSQFATAKTAREIDLEIQLKHGNKNYGECKLILAELVSALENTNWSSWQTTARFDEQLQSAIKYLEG